jgi:AcrR family transcriptional regulator
MYKKIYTDFMSSTQLKEIQQLCPRDRVIAATLHLISCAGVDAVTHRRVAALAGVSPGTTTHHFSGRAELLRESFMAYLQQLDDSMSQRAHEPDVPPTQAVREGLLSLITNEFNDIPMLRAEYELLLAASLDAKLAEAVNAWEKRAACLIATALEKAKVQRPTEAALTLINFTRGFELERLYKPNLCVDDFSRRLEPLLTAMCSSK